VEKVVPDEVFVEPTPKNKIKDVRRRVQLKRVRESYYLN
jgi:hypothetical protein